MTSTGTNQDMGDMEFPEISFPELEHIVQTGEMLIIDVRQPQEVAEAHLNARTFINIPLKELEAAFAKPSEDFKRLFSFDKPNKNDDIAFICRSGRRTKLALELMQQIGYPRSCHFDGGTLRLLKDHPEMVIKSDQDKPV